VIFFLRLGLAQRTLDGGDEFGELVLEHVIRRAALEGLDREVLPHRARDEDERNVRTLVPRDGQRRETVEIRQPVVGKDHVGLVMFELVQERLAGLDALGTEADVRPAQLVIDQNHVRGDVFENQDAHFILHANTAGESASFPKYRRRPAAALKVG